MGLEGGGNPRGLRCRELSGAGWQRSKHNMGMGSSWEAACSTGFLARREDSLRARQRGIMEPQRAFTAANPLRNNFLLKGDGKWEKKWWLYGKWAGRPPQPWPVIRLWHDVLCRVRDKLQPMLKAVLVWLSRHCIWLLYLLVCLNRLQARCVLFLPCYYIRRPNQSQNPLSLISISPMAPPQKMNVNLKANFQPSQVVQQSTTVLSPSATHADTDCILNDTLFWPGPKYCTI